METRNIGDQILNPTSNIKLGAFGHGLGLKFEIGPIQVVKSPPKVEAFNNSWNMPLMTSLIIASSVDPNSWISFLKQFTS